MKQATGFNSYTRNSSPDPVCTANISVFHFPADSYFILRPIITCKMTSWHHTQLAFCSTAFPSIIIYLLYANVRTIKKPSHKFRATFLEGTKTQHISFWLQTFVSFMALGVLRIVIPHYTV